VVSDVVDSPKRWFLSFCRVHFPFSQAGSPFLSLVTMGTRPLPGECGWKAESVFFFLPGFWGFLDARFLIADCTFFNLSFSISAFLLPSGVPRTVFHCYDGDRPFAVSLYGAFSFTTFPVLPSSLAQASFRREGWSRFFPGPPPPQSFLHWILRSFIVFEGLVGIPS